MAKPSGMPTSAPRNTPDQHPEDADPDVLPERHVAEALGRELDQPVPGARRSAARRTARSSRRPRRAHQSTQQRARPSAATRPAPSRRRSASPKRTVFCRVNGLSASPSQTASLRRPAVRRRSSLGPPMICLLHLPDHRQDLLARRHELGRGLDRARRRSASAARGEGQARTRARSARAAAPSRSRRSPRKSASSTEWVMSRMVVPVSCQSCSTRPCIFSRVSASSAPSGSSIRITFGSLARQRASATRCCMPPGELVDRRVAEARAARPCPSSSSTRAAVSAARPAAPCAARSRRCRRPSATRRARPAGRPCRGPARPGHRPVADHAPRPAVGREEARDDVEQRGLAAAGRARARSRSRPGRRRARRRRAPAPLPPSGGGIDHGDVLDADARQRLPRLARRSGAAGAPAAFTSGSSGRRRANSRRAPCRGCRRRP